MTITIRRKHLTALSQEIKRQTDGVKRCPAKYRNGTKCNYPAGHRTDHAGSGKCWIHEGGEAFKTTQRYRGIKATNVAERLRQLNEVDEDVMDLLPDIQLIRAMVIDYIERYQEFTDALVAWYQHGKQKPKNIFDLAAAVNYVEAISRVAERVHRINDRGAVSIETFRRIVEQMGIVVAKHVRDGTALQNIEEEWSGLVLDARTTVRALPPADVSNTPVSPSGTVPAVTKTSAGRSRRRSRPTTMLDPDTDPTLA